MKYQKLENQEAHWKWLYLAKKVRNGETISRYQERSLEDEKANELLQLQHYPALIEDWIRQHLANTLVIKLDQAIRARRKRFFNAEKRATKKKSIDLEYAVWSRLSKHSRKMRMTLSETIMYMIDEAENKDLYASQVDLMKKNLQELLE
ncbi:MULTISPECIES: macrodomain Ter protein MatP [Testudinibacter]|uniref:Macrodomain Ter protein n=1 Tax=Testudinibacter aquarius TaxID=1524974 RepID=A0A4R3Y6C9_9PAST|nr:MULTISPECIES: macrodomain Ter protein MatP [Testudinibacter]TNG94120.1 macrodomain Ter protein MatP [Pasteurellaceae bacterium UScroc12]TNG97523.1 macrodomain Ter protein MatP [Pasteurellaceae bacterium USgator41]TNG99331.1 macrodomain Ter protein MatP [Pasteurellaceae bacterium USgator11]TNG99575.1 macrodomain Ter protein MatP [Pasteurellaceae bacterium UScroc31]TNH03624.1 macrodomain Ter protein MatP [Pasteurellaceae bacterium Phil11]TNH03901.1 macrodomain Ter protein MatP [Pasteurellace